MFDKTSRSVYEEGLRFYEEDILFDSHVYHANQKVYLELDYIKNGAGVMIGLMPNQPLEKQNLYYFVRIDAYSASLFLVNQMHFQRLDHVSTPICAPTKNLKIGLDITPNQIVLSLNDKNYMYTALDYSIGDHHLGVYSQKDNTFYKMHVESKAPKMWRVNMQGAQNGRITFKRNQINFSDCKYPAELLQECIRLMPGTYYLKYEGEGVTPYVYALESSFVDLEHKNILRPDNTFVIEDTQNIGLYFTGRNGYIKNISLSRFEDAPYIETYLDQSLKSESYLRIKLDQIKDVTLRFNVKEESFGTILQDATTVHRRALITGEHSIVIRDNILYLYHDDEYLEEYNIYGDVIDILKGYQVFIYQIYVTDNDNKVFDWFKRNDKSDWLQPSLNSPILAVNDADTPLDLSASFRVVNNKYIFTNTERETFDVYPVIRLSKPIEALIGVYGIPKSAIVNEEKFYNGLPENPDDLSAYCQVYEPIKNCTFDKMLNQVIFYDSLQNYKEIIVDYKKRDSYAINFVSEIGKYNVQTTADHYSYFYSIDGQEQYAKTIHKEEENRYIVLQKGDDLSEN